MNQIAIGCEFAAASAEEFELEYEMSHLIKDQLR